MDKILIIYSNPADTERLRLDKEHRALDKIIDSLNLSLGSVVRRHASSFKDLCSSIADDEYSIFQFSGHGTHEGIYLENDSGNASELITAERVAEVISKAQPRLKAAIFMSCFSADAIPTLLRIAPYILTVFGPANDNNAIEFIGAFYKNYFKFKDIAKACSWAQIISQNELQVVLSRRAQSLLSRTPLFEVFPGSGIYAGTSFLIDLSEAEADIATLNVPREKFLSILTRKIRLHNRIFDTPRERAVLPVGPYVGIFTWNNAFDPIQCHRILQIKTETKQEAYDLWARLAITYNDDANHRYRLESLPASPHNIRLLEAALTSYRSDYEWINSSSAFHEYIPDQYKLAKSVMNANLDMAEKKLHDNNLVSVVYHLESALSALHDLLDAFTDSLTKS